MYKVAGTKTKRQESTIGNYVILKTIGYGGFGVVKLVRSMTDKTEYAMKVFELEASEKEHIQRNTENEYLKVAALNLKSIPTYYEFAKDVTWTKSNGKTKEVSYLLMENC